MLNSGLLQQLNGVISTGKEANVYHAICGTFEGFENTELAIKIYKTTLNEFKNRTEYIEGEFRFRFSSTNNTRKLIKVWAEKEMRNLKRLQQHNIPVPTPIFQRENILVMSFLGKDGFPAPRLKDVELTESKTQSCYTEIIKIMRKMYHQCRLVHADLSEYNILYHKGKLMIIDVSQSVETNHPRSLEFLKNDINCITTFFQKRGAEHVLTPLQLFNFVTDTKLTEETEDLYLNKMKEQPQESDSSTEAVFQKAHISRTLQDLNPYTEESFHETVTGLKSVLDNEKE